MNMTDFNTSNYPLNCVDDTGGGFSGWFAIYNYRQCNDFCYWQLPSQKSSYAAWNTGNPHKSAVMTTPIGTAYWTCAYNSTDDKTLVSVAEEHRWVDSWRKYYSSQKDGSLNLEDVDLCNLVTPTIDELQECSNKDEVNAINAPAKNGAVTYPGSASFFPAPWLVNTIMDAGTSNPFKLIPMTNAVASKFYVAHKYNEE
jgi:hypothetical protein